MSTRYQVFSPRVRMWLYAISYSMAYSCIRLFLYTLGIYKIY